MNHLLRRSEIRNFLSCSKGATAVEYGVIATAMFMAIIPAFLYVSTGMTRKLQGITDYFNSLI